MNMTTLIIGVYVGRERQCSGLFPLHNNRALSWFGHLTVVYLSVNAHLLNGGTQRTLGAIVCPLMSRVGFGMKTNCVTA